MEPISRPQWEIYTDEELKAGAERWGLTVQQERERIRLMQSDVRTWPGALLTFLRASNYGKYPGVPTFSIDVLLWGVIQWLKQRQNPNPASS